MKERKKSLTRLANNLYRCTQAYTNEVLLKYQLSSGTYPFLLILKGNEGINQNQISRELNIDKAMSARAIKSLIALGYLRREYDKEDSRAHKLFLTEKAEEIIPEVVEELNRWNTAITEGLTDIEKERILEYLEKGLENAKNHKNKFLQNEG